MYELKEESDAHNVETPKLGVSTNNITIILPFQTDYYNSNSTGTLYWTSTDFPS